MAPAIRTLLPIAEAFLVAPAAPAAAFALWLRSLDGFFVAAFVVALGHALVLGVPLFALMRWRGWVNVFTTTLAAFVIGCVPIAFLLWPLRHANLPPTAWDGAWGQAIVPTAAGWLAYGSAVLLFGAFGALAGVVFWFYLRVRGASRGD